MDAPENLDLVNIHFRFDINHIFDYSSLLLWLNNIVQEEYIAIAFHHKKSIEQYKILRRNLQKVVDKYFFWDYENYPDPMDQYIYICENWEKLFKNVIDGVNQDITLQLKNVDKVFKPIFLYDLLWTVSYIQNRLKYLSEMLLEKGLKHQFRRSDKPNDKYIPD